MSTWTGPKKIFFPYSLKEVITQNIPGMYTELEQTIQKEYTFMRQTMYIIVLIFAVICHPKKAALAYIPLWRNVP